MKKGKIITSAILAAVMLVGAGYAAWTDKLTINSTVSTGEFNVEFAEPQYYLLDDYTGQNGSITTDGYATAKYAPFIATGNSKTLTLTLDNLYPGIGATLNTQFKNSGTIPAVIKSISYKTDLSESLKGKNNKDLRQMTATEKAKITVVGALKLHKANGDVYADKIINLNTNLKDFGAELNKLNWRLEPNEYVSFDDVNFKLPSNAVNENEMENTYVKCTLELNFGQHNAN